MKKASIATTLNKFDACERQPSTIEVLKTEPSRFQRKVKHNRYDELSADLKPVSDASKKQKIDSVSEIPPELLAQIVRHHILPMLDMKNKHSIVKSSRTQ